MSAHAVPPRSARRPLRLLAGAVAFCVLTTAAPGSAQEPTEWNALVHRAEQAVGEARWDEARTLLEGALARVGTGPGVASGERAAALANLAVAYHGLAELDRADATAERAYRLARSAVIPNLRAMGRARYTRGNVASDRGQLDEAIEHYQLALVVLEDAVGREHPEVAATLSVTGRVYLDLNRPEKAVPLLRRARAIRVKVPSSDPLSVARLDRDLGYAYATQSDPRRAAAHYEEALPALERWSTPGADLAVAFEDAAVQNRKLGRLAESERLLSRSVVLLEGEFGPDHPRVANALYGVAVLALDRDDAPRARALFARCVEIWGAAPEPRDARLEAVRERIAELDATLPAVAVGDSGSGQ